MYYIYYICKDYIFFLFTINHNIRTTTFRQKLLVTFVGTIMDEHNKSTMVSMLPVGLHHPSHHRPVRHHPGLSYKGLPFVRSQTWQQELDTDKHIKNDDVRAGG